jgi:hypothetical protein
MSLISLECDDCGRHYVHYEPDLCPWCEIERLRAERDALCPDCYTKQLRHDLHECRRLLREAVADIVKWNVCKTKDGDLVAHNAWHSHLWYETVKRKAGGGDE